MQDLIPLSHCLWQETIRLLSQSSPLHSHGQLNHITETLKIVFKPVWSWRRLQNWGGSGSVVSSTTWSVKAPVWTNLSPRVLPMKLLWPGACKSPPLGRNPKGFNVHDCQAFPRVLLWAAVISLSLLLDEKYITLLSSSAVITHSANLVQGTRSSRMAILKQGLHAPAFLWNPQKLGLISKPGVQQTGSWVWEKRWSYLPWKLSC